MLFHCEVAFNGTPLATTIVGTLLRHKTVQHILLIHTTYGTEFVLSLTEQGGCTWLAVSTLIHLHLGQLRILVH